MWKILQKLEIKGKEKTLQLPWQTPLTMTDPTESLNKILLNTTASLKMASEMLTMTLTEKHNAGTRLWTGLMELKLCQTPGLARTRTIFKGSLWLWPLGGGDSSVVRAPDSWLKGRGFESLLERREKFLLQGRLSVLTLISVSVAPPCYHSST